VEVHARAGDLGRGPEAGAHLRVLLRDDAADGLMIDLGSVGAQDGGQQDEDAGEGGYDGPDPHARSCLQGPDEETSGSRS